MAADIYRIPLEPIESSNLQALGYDPKRLILAVQFKNGDVYHYAGVSTETFSEFYTAESKGRYYSASIRGKFTGDKMTGPCPKCGDKGLAGLTCEDCGCAEYEKEQLPPRHALSWDETGKPTRSPLRRALCGVTVRVKEIAPNIDAVTCATCKERLDERDRMEI